MNSPTSRIRILHLINGFAIGGAERHLLQCVRHVDRRAFDVTLCSVGQGGSLQKDFEAIGFPVLVFPKRNRFDLSLIPKVARLIRRRRIDILQTDLFYADMIGGLAARFSPETVFISVECGSHGEDDPLRVSPRHVLGYRLVMKYVDVIVAVSNEIRETLIKNRGIGTEKIITIPYGIDIRRIDGSSRVGSKAAEGPDKKFRTFGCGPVVGIVARLDEVKGHTFLFQALSLLKGEFPTLQCHVVGDGPLRNHLEEEVKTRGLESVVHFFGFRQDVYDFYRTIDVIVLPSRTEGLPMTVLEAMAFGNPVVASRVGGIPEAVLDGRTGFLVPPKDSVSLAQALRRLILNPSLRKQMGIEGRRRVEEIFSFDREMAAYETLYRSALVRKRKKLTENKR